jgi:PKD repeat protein
MYVAYNVAGCSDTAYLQVTVYPKPTADFVLSQDSSCVYPVTVQLTNQSVGASGYDWNFGVQGTSTLVNPSVTFNQPGVYPITLIAQSGFGCKDTVVKTFQVFDPPVAVPLIADPDVCENEWVQFTHASVNGVYFYWDFGDGDSSNVENPVHIYTNSGVYTVQLTVVGLGGCTATASISTPINVFDSPDAAFTYAADPDTMNYGTIIFTNQSTGASTYHWDFGDGDTSNVQDPIHQYQLYGDYDVTLIAYNDFGCPDTAIESLFVDYFAGLEVPNAFIPSSTLDGVNVFWPQGRGLKTYKLEIFDTWGNKIWESDKLERGIPSEYWDGRSMYGVDMPGDVYVWKVEATFLNGERWEGQTRKSDRQPRYTGTITLIR